MGAKASGSATLLALLVCLFLGGVIYLQLEAGGHAEAPTVATVDTAAERVALPAETSYEPPIFAEFSEAIDRPLFAPSRRPPREAAPEVVAVAAQKQSFGFELVGVLISPEERVALIRQDGVTDLQRVSPGRRLNGWQVELIEPDHVVFRSGETVRQVHLRDDTPPVQETLRERRRREREEEREALEQEADDSARDRSGPTRIETERAARDGTAGAVARAPDGREN